MFRSRVVAGVLLALLLAALCGCAASSAGEGASADVSGEGNGLVGLRVAIDAGHGGIDQGAVGAAGTLEENINLEISKELAKQFVLAGADVLMTRENNDVDYSGTGSTKKSRDMKNRARMVTEQDSQIFISIHLNSYPDGRYRGAQTFYQKGSGEENKKLADAVQEALVDGLPGGNKRLSKQGDYYVLKITKNPSILVEAGFLSNREEEKLLNQHDYQNRIAGCIFRGVCSYLGVQ